MGRIANHGTWWLLATFLAAFAVSPIACNQDTATEDAGQDANEDAGQDAGGDAAEDAGHDAGPLDGADAGGDPIKDAGEDAGGDEDPVPGPECTRADECTLHADCCNCLALAPDQDPPTCDVEECPADACTLLGFDPTTGASCAAGRCIVGFDCDHKQVMCAVPTPVCDPGEIASVRGVCWGECVPVSDCGFLNDCQACDPALFVCVANVAQLITYHCVKPPPACERNRKCDCLATNVCVDPFRLCTDSVNVNQVDCNCPNC